MKKPKLDQRDKNIIAFMKKNELNSLSTVQPEDGNEDGPEASFSSNGCDICDDGLGNNVYPCHGYSAKHKKIFDGFDVCHDCICRIYNGE